MPVIYAKVSPEVKRTAQRLAAEDYGTESSLVRKLIMHEDQRREAAKLAKNRDLIGRAQ